LVAGAHPENKVAIRAPGVSDLCPEIKREALLAADIYYDHTKKLHYAKVDFNTVIPAMPPALSKRVHEDNASFLVEKYMFSPGFFESALNMMDLMIKRNPESLSQTNEYSTGIYKFVEKQVFEILPWGKKNKEVKKMTQILI
jgi:hypothetical protein